MTAAERQAEERILAWCRTQREGIVMRNLFRPGSDGHKYGVVDVAPMVSVRLVTGDTWVEVESKLRTLGVLR